MADAATTALIARMVAEDAYAQGPADIADSGPEESGSDYDERRPAKKRKAPGKGDWAVLGYEAYNTSCNL